MNISKLADIYFQLVADGLCIALHKGNMLKIERSEGPGLTIFSVSGRIGEMQVSELQHILDAESAHAALDLEEVKLAGREAVRFLAACEARGIELKNCPSYIREWIGTGSYTSHEL